MNDEVIPDKFIRTILNLKELNIRMHVALNNEKNTFHNEYTYGDKKYVSLEPPGVYITLGLNKINDTFMPDRTLVLSQMTIGIVVKGMQRILNNLYNEKIFTIRDNEIISYSDMVEKFTEKISLPRTAQAIVIKPAVVYDENEVSYEGVRLFINKQSNIVDLTIDEFEALVYTLSQVNLFQYSQLIMNYIAIKYPNTIQPNNTQFKKYRKNISWDKPGENKVNSTFKKTVDDGTFIDGIKILND